MNNNSQGKPQPTGGQAMGAAIVGVIALLLAIVFTIFTQLMLFWMLPAALGLIGVILAVASRRRQQRATLGLLTSAVALILSLVLMAGCVLGCVQYQNEDTDASYSQPRRDADGNLVGNDDAPELTIDE